MRNYFATVVNSWLIMQHGAATRRARCCIAAWVAEDGLVRVTLV